MPIAVFAPAADQGLVKRPRYVIRPLKVGERFKAHSGSSDDPWDDLDDAVAGFKLAGAQFPEPYALAVPDNSDAQAGLNIRQRATHFV